MANLFLKSLLLCGVDEKRVGRGKGEVMGKESGLDLTPFR